MRLNSYGPYPDPPRPTFRAVAGSIFARRSFLFASGAFAVFLTAGLVGYAALSPTGGAEPFLSTGLRIGVGYVLGVIAVLVVRWTAGRVRRYDPPGETFLWSDESWRRRFVRYAAWAGFARPGAQRI